MKLDLNFQLKGLSGQEIPGEQGHAGKNLAGALASSNKGNSIKLYDWSMKLWNKEPIMVDDTDKEVIKGFLENTEFMTVLSKAQVINHMKETEEADKKKSEKALKKA